MSPPENRAARHRSNLLPAAGDSSAAAAVSAQPSLPSPTSDANVRMSSNAKLQSPSSARTMQEASGPIAGLGSSSVPGTATAGTATDAGTASSFPDASSAPDVETTNWNAVKLLATKYGIHLRPYEEEQAAAAAAAANNASAQASSATSPSARTHALLASDTTDSDELDYGRGTPFRITAKRIEGGRTVYRFKYRNDAASQAEAISHDSNSPTIPRSSSESVALAASHEMAFGIDEANGGDVAFKARRGRSGSKSNASGIGSTGRNSKGRAKALKASKSIPTLRSMGLMGAVSGQSKHAAGPSSATSGWVVVPPLPNQPEAGNTPPMPQHPSAFLTPPQAAAHAMSHSSRSVSNPLDASDRLRAAEADRLQGGDVLGAILGLRQEQQQEAEHAQAQQQQHILSTYESKSADVSLRTGLEAHAAANAARRAAPPSSWRGPSPFGHPVVPMSRGGSASSSSSVGRAPIANVPWDKSPIPQMTDFGEPLFQDVDKFAAAQGRSPHSSTDQELRQASVQAETTGAGPSVRHTRSRSASRSAASPRQRLLREAQSFESTDSAATARAGEERISLAALPRAILPHLDISEAEEVLQDEEYTDEDEETARTVPVSSIRAKDEETLIFDVLQHYSLSDAASLISPATSTSGGDSKRSSLATTLSSGDEQSPMHTRTHSSTEDPHLGFSSATSKDSARVAIASATCGDDPRFAIWALRPSEADSQLQLCGRDGRMLPESPVLGDAPFGRQSKNSTATDGVAPTLQTSHAAAAAKRYSTARAVTGEGGSISAATSPPVSAGSGNQPGHGRARSGSRSKRAGSLSGTGAFMSPSSSQLPKPFLIAGTSTRIVSELTSEIDGRLLTDFFLTFRSFMAACELLSLLIARFRWAMARSVGPSDEAQRRIVRVRTYVVLKHWLSNFFEADFLPDRALRRQLTEWLNKVGSEQELQSRPADAGIIRSLKKLVRSLKDQYQSAGMSGLLLHESGRSDSNPSESSPETGHASNASFALASQAARSTASSSAEEVDLNFSEESGEDAPKTGSFGTVQYAPAESSNPTAPSSEGSVGADKYEAARTSHGRGASARVVRHRHTLAPASRQQLAPASPFQPYGSTATSTPQPGMLPPVLPSSQNPISRVFVNTVGRISRFRRVIGQRGAPNNASEPSGIDGLEFEANESGDLLYIRGGLENFISFFGLRDEDQKDGIRHALASHLDSAEALATGRSASTEEEAPGNMSSDSAGESAGLDGTPSLSGASAQTRSTPASSLDLSSSERQGVGLDIGAHTGLGIEGAGIAVDPISVASAVAPDEKAQRVDTALSTPDQGQPLALAENALDEESPKQVDGGEQHPVHHAPSASTLRSDDTVIRTPSLRQGQHSNGPRSSMLAGHKRVLGSRKSVRSIASLQSTSGDRPNIVQIDDIDLSSDEDDGVVRRALRRLPGARDLRMAQHVQDLEPAKAVRLSLESLASFNPGRVYSPTTARASIGNASLVRAPGVGGPSSNYAPSILSTRMSFMERQRAEAELMQPHPVVGMLQTDLFDPDEALAGYELVRGFRLDLADSDDEEPGDVEAALRRLEGVIDEDKQRSKAKRVEKLFLESLARNAQATTAETPASGQAFDEAGSARLSTLGKTSVHSAEDTRTSVVEPHTEPRTSHVSDLPDLIAAFNADRQGRFEAQRSELPAPRLPDKPTQRRKSHGSALAHTQSPSSAQQTPQLGNMLWNPPPVHRSFLLQYSSEVMAQQLCLIEAELLKAVTWEELVSDRWNQKVGVVNDWETFYQGRVRARAEALSDRKSPHLDSAVSAIVARFNLTCNWVASEIVLTQNVDERAAVVAKFIRVAFKCWQHSNFASLAQIVFGLQSPWVERLRRTWSRIGMWEMRVLRDLKSFVSPVRNFRLMRNAMRDMVSDAYVDDMASVGTARPPSVRLNGAAMGGATAKGTVSEGCIPFFGLFISDLAINDALPSLLDPSSPSAQPVNFHKTTQDGSRLELILAEPHAFDHLPPLPPCIKLEPLINVYKARNTAAIVKTVMAFQQRARLYPYEASAAVYVKALKIRSLDSNQMTQ